MTEPSSNPPPMPLHHEGKPIAERLHGVEQDLSEVTRVLGKQIASLEAEMLKRVLNADLRWARRCNELEERVASLELAIMGYSRSDSQLTPASEGRH